MQKALAEGTLAPTPAGDRHLDHCLGCRRSEAACPADTLASPAVTCRPSTVICDSQEQCSGTSVACPADQIATAKSMYEVAVNNARELAEIAMKAQSEAVDVLTKCAMANIDDLKSLAKTA